MPATIRLKSGKVFTVTDQVWDGDDKEILGEVLKVVALYDYTPADGDPDTAEAEYVIGELGGEIIENNPRPWNVDPERVY